MMANYSIVEGTTGNLQFQLFDNGVAINLTGLTVTLLLEDRNGLTVTPGTVSIIDATNGKVQLTPASSATFVAANGPYLARWQLTDAGGLVTSVPTSTRDQWNIMGL